MSRSWSSGSCRPPAVPETTGGFVFAGTAEPRLVAAMPVAATTASVSAVTAAITRGRAIPACRNRGCQGNRSMVSSSVVGSPPCALRRSDSNASRRLQSKLTQSCPVRPRRPHLPWPMRARCRSTSGIKVSGATLAGGTWRHTPAAGGACGGLAIAARETRTPQCESLPRSVTSSGARRRRDRGRTARAQLTQPTDVLVDPHPPPRPKSAAPNRRAISRATADAQGDPRSTDRSPMDSFVSLASPAPAPTVDASPGSGHSGGPSAEDETTSQRPRGRRRPAR